LIKEVIIIIIIITRRRFVMCGCDGGHVMWPLVQSQDNTPIRPWLYTLSIIELNATLERDLSVVIMVWFARV